MNIEVNLDSLVGPSHHFGGMGVGNLASIEHRWQVSHPRAAALQGLAKMKTIAELGVPQHFLPPLPRPNLPWLSSLGIHGSIAEQLQQALDLDPTVLSAAYSSAFMWAANAATVCPSSDSSDGRLHVTVANLAANLHRAPEAEDRFRHFQSLLSNVPDAMVHSALPPCSHLRDEGAANHMRLWGDDARGGLHIFVYGSDGTGGGRFPTRHSLLASRAVALRHGIAHHRSFFLEQHPQAIDAGVFHNDVIGTSHRHCWIHHELAYHNADEEIANIERAFNEQCGRLLLRIVVRASELSLEDAVQSYLFNSQIVDDLSSDDAVRRRRMVLICPRQCQDRESAKRLIDSWIADDSNPIDRVVFMPLDESMAGGGGPACLRLRVPVNHDQYKFMKPAFACTEERFEWLDRWINRWYVDRLELSDLLRADFAEHALAAIAELYRELSLE